MRWLLPILVVLGSAGFVLMRADESAVSTDVAKTEPKATAPEKAPRLPVKRAAPRQPSVLTGELDHAGNPVSVSCATCHTTRKADFRAGTEKTPTEFHLNLDYAHGKLSCLSCHNSHNYDTLRRADGQIVAYQDAVKLCAQCHGPQTRDYEHGTHGGMVGYWDKSRGKRDRNLCTDCHDVHSPAYPKVMPVFPPRDRGALEQALRQAVEAHNEHSSSETHD